ncbi:glycosyltransferase [Chroococcidiopsis sp. FACHB-1243]|uniref:glycosyltransferase family protein n=1 Tax=Chroococcidiopsis sp. [FACHB-1243] TaxID=2692781 RepID=UPI0017807C01|nr:glycosyltransferase [Chroococcidiopsis sp. [FACHB-1243]]MBD2309833.1 glycosyltransferase [Chroococcidiopsis sp. [FACHB-1243]]
MNAIPELINKPKLVYFQRKYEHIAKFVRLHYQQQVNCLAEFFDVTVINEDCDYQEICDRYQPEITLFEIGISAWGYTRLNIQNTSVYPEIPKLGFYHADCFCEARSAFIADIENWGIQTLFSLSVRSAEYMPELGDRIFTWSNFIDPDLYRDYACSKTIPVLFTGSNTSFYPWRQQILKVVSQAYPSLISPHFGYEEKTAFRMLYGQQYARTINASWFVPACGTIVREVVRKHFEIPACKSCLITEKTPALEAAGFVDMQNCVFADETDVLDKIDYLFQNPEELERITNAGYQLVHSQHTFKQRDQIFQWFNLNKIIKPGQKIIQNNPFGELTLVEEISRIKSMHIINNTVDKILLHQGDEKLWNGKYDEAESLYLCCLNSLIQMLPEPKLRLAICSLYKGNAQQALSWILQPIECILVLNKASEPDPVEWAYLIIILLCQGKLSEATERINQFPSLNHPELDRVRWAIEVLNNSEKQVAIPDNNLSNYRISVHQLPKWSFSDWVTNVCTMLKACQQLTFAENLNNASGSKEQFFQEGSLKFKYIINNLLNFAFKRKMIKFNSLLPTSSYINFRFTRRITLKIKSKLKPRVIQLLNSLEESFGCFLPYHLSIFQNDEFFSAIKKLTQEENIKTFLTIGALTRLKTSEIFFTGIQKSQNKIKIFCVDLPTTKVQKIQQRYLHDSLVEFHNFLIYQKSVPNTREISKSAIFCKYLNKNDCRFLFNSLYQNSKDLNSIKLAENTIKKIRQENQLDYFDMILIGDPKFDISAEFDEIHRAKFVVIDSINSLSNHNLLHRLLAQSGYAIVAQNLFLRNGYAILKRTDRARTLPTAIDADRLSNLECETI